jgi:uncharacterized protein YecE (DUF72 family)
MKKLKDPEDPLRGSSKTHARSAAPRPVLYQLPPRWPLNLERFESFLRALPRGYRHTVEFRDPSWYDDRVYELLRATTSRCAFTTCRVRLRQGVVGPFIYVRFHFGTQKYGGPLFR